MYSDENLLREIQYKVRLNKYENALVDALVGYTGQPKAALIRTLLLEQVALELAKHDPDYASRAEFGGPK